MRNFKRVYLMDELETVWEVMRLEDFDHLNIDRYVRQYWHNQFDDDRVLGAMLEPEFKVGKNLFKDGTRFVYVQPPVTPGSNHERFGGMSQLDEEMEVVESAETMEGVEEEAILDEPPVKEKKGLLYGPRGKPNTQQTVCY
ncbi:hypothetical protein INT45_003278 [Circinella minor]|uniref:Uncharacterized protein n=1 Tax=Circinella minor TaxID=1195481 RepID=A0A8H7RVR9_9FUNG|nr:hypothetical protein INT45_004081 [Circinella minor]KAG2225078.1 hypothetical protein INT45_003278 [Circinella minor]